MLKRDELAIPDSCLNKARSDERVFVLLARDAAAPVAIKAWCDERVRLGKNAPADPQILEALDCATKMNLERPSTPSDKWSALVGAARAVIVQRDQFNDINRRLQRGEPVSFTVGGPSAVDALKVALDVFDGKVG